MEQIEDSLRVIVLMSTYNGDRFLSEQLDSLLEQSIQNIDVLIRDDGSSDRTEEILNEYAQNNPSIKWFSGGKNLKPPHSFFDLIQRVAEDYDFYFFCDQDDIWMPDKISVAVKSFKSGNNLPALYYCATELVDAELDHIGYDFREYEFTSDVVYSFLRGSLITGCTMCFNKTLMKALKRYIPVRISMHDSWVHLLCLSLGGTIIADPHAHIKYRQHDSNVLGIHKMSLYEKIKNGLRRKTIYREMASQITHEYNDVNEKSLYFMSLFVNYDKSILNSIRFIKYVLSLRYNFTSRFYISLKILLKLY